MASPGWKYSEFCQESVKSENQIFIIITLCPSVQCSDTDNIRAYIQKVSTVIIISNNYFKDVIQSS